MKESPLREWRKKMKLSQGQLGKRIGVDEMTISRWELGVTDPQKRHWPKIKKVTGLSRQQFLGFGEVAA